MNSQTSFIQFIRHMSARLSASDPGRMRLMTAIKITLSVILSVITTNYFLLFLDNSSTNVTMPIFAGVVGLVSSFVLFDETEAQKKVTIWLMGLSSAISITTGSFLLDFYHLSDVMILIVVFLAFYLSRFSIRYFSICMIAFLSIYFTTILDIQFNQVAWYYLSITIGILYSYFFNFILLQYKPNQVLKKSMHSFHIQTNLILHLVKEMVISPSITSRQIKTLDRNLTKLNEYARNISGQLGTTNPGNVWKGIRANELRLYVYDAEMLMQTLSPTIQRLRELQAFQETPFQDALLDVLESIRNVRVLRDDNVLVQLNRAEKAIQALRAQIRNTTSEDQEEWLYLVRRIESIANHVIEGASELHEERVEHLEKDQEDIVEEDDSKTENQKGLYPATKKAIQAVIAGSVSVYLGYTLTPTHPYWILLSSFIIFMGTESVGSTFVKANQRTLGTVLGAVVGFGVAQLISHTTVEIAFIFFSIFMAFYLFPVSYSVMIFWITMIIAMLYDLLLGGITQEVMGVRVVDTFIGAYIGLLAATLVFPTKTRDKVAETMTMFLEELSSYIEAYLDHLLGKEQHNNFAEKSFELDQQLYQLRIDSISLRNRPGRLARSGIERWLTVLIAINYYAKHLHSTRHPIPDMDAIIENTLTHTKQYVIANITNVIQLIKGHGNITVWELEEDRKIVERYSNQRSSLSQQLFVYKLYYIWRINQSIVTLATDMGAAVQPAPSSMEENDK
ncbi:FUSC family protein [Pontibacillus yanchengensis]|nr:FUSC family protein [Pontibacillus yanchengensis]